ncbi:alpha-L-arabinofuranosidase C-terminal domain-containing protein [Cellvibrio mixtus]|uniref:alpha-L-arabinofuranosidase C-terminal domain-containing protein n=1 Tax=Cellvibrio mixtus TaxID=39650 RepID=UPI0006939621|nr:alpha-L-arabinofuranosidase C-terminal domain-containing protein [Cellvibrio mixtus]
MKNIRAALKTISFFSVFSLCSTPSVAQENIPLDVDLTASANIQPTMYGIFFEDINFSADGGLYAELVKNRSFEFEQPMMGWSQPATDPYATNENSGIANTLHFADNKTNKNVLRINVFNDQHYSLVNEGFRGMGIHNGEGYLLSFYANNPNRTIKNVVAQLIDAKGEIIASTKVSLAHADWHKYESRLVAKRTEEKASLRISFEGTGTLDMDMVSLFPNNTWKGREKGLRKDLVQLLADLKPGFLRFPGGCIIEGRTLAQRYQWKNTLGQTDSRPTMVSRWNTEFKHKLTPDYFQSFGLGFYEYFQLAEDLGAEPIPVLSCGIACQFNTGELVPVSELDPYIQDALDLIEFANGTADSPWGKVRVEMGHPKPFNLKYIGIGNEQWGPQYIERYKIFQTVLKKKYPDIILVSGSGPFAEGQMFDYAHRELKKLGADIIDEHYYKDIAWFKNNATRYDDYDRNGPKIFAGEYAAQSVAVVSPDNKNSWETALAEAAFMTGLERNADLVHMTSYAPLMAHTEAWQWSPNMIWFNNLQALATANYQVQKLFSNNKGTELVRITHDGKPLTGQDGLYASAVTDKQNKSLTLKLVNTNAQALNIQLNMPAGVMKGKATVTLLSANNLQAENSFASPSVITPITHTEKFNNVATYKAPPHSVSVISIPVMQKNISVKQ